MCDMLGIQGSLPVTNSVKFGQNPYMDDGEYADYSELDHKPEIVNGLDDIASEIKSLSLENQEKSLIINLLDYIAQNYMKREKSVIND